MEVGLILIIGLVAVNISMLYSQVKRIADILEDKNETDDTD